MATVSEEEYARQLAAEAEEFGSYTIARENLSAQGVEVEGGDEGGFADYDPFAGMGGQYQGTQLTTEQQAAQDAYFRSVGGSAPTGFFWDAIGMMDRPYTGGDETHPDGWVQSIPGSPTSSWVPPETGTNQPTSSTPTTTTTAPLSGGGGNISTAPPPTSFPQTGQPGAPIPSQQGYQTQYMPQGETFGQYGTERDTFNNPYEVGSPQWWEYTQGEPAGFLSQLGLWGKAGRTPYQSYQESLLPSLQNLYGMAGDFSLQGLGPSPGGFMGEWAQPYTENPFAMYAQAQGMMGQTLGMGAEQRAELGLQGPTQSLQNLLGMGLRPSIGARASSSLAGRLPFLQQQWSAQYPQAGSPDPTTGESRGPNFLDYVSQKYNLGRYF